MLLLPQAVPNNSQFPPLFYTLFIPGASVSYHDFYTDYPQSAILSGINGWGLLKIPHEAVFTLFEQEADLSDFFFEFAIALEVGFNLFA
jgi:hypothetical protein